MKAFKITLTVLLVIALAVLPFVTAFITLVVTPPQYENTFLGVLDDKYERLNSIEDDKIVIVGGSSVAFGIDSQLMETYTGMPVVNFGLYAALGTKMMLDMSKSGISKGDIVIIAPEIEAQTLSLYFNTSSALHAIDSDYSMLTSVSADNIFSLVGGMWDLANEKLSYINNGNSPTPTGVYSASSFNEYGDIIYSRGENIMPLYYDPNTKITLDESIVSDDFIDYLNDYIAYCRLLGADVYFSWSPMNSLAVVNPEGASAFEEYMRSSLNCEIISSIDKYILEPEYFYDTNFHMNDSGVLRHSVNLIKDILLAMGRPTLVETPEGADPSLFPGLVTVTKPELPNVDNRYFGSDENDKYFTYIQNENGSYTVTGLSELGKLERVLTLPLGTQTYLVSAVAPGAFSGGVLEELIIPENTSIKLFENGAFESSSLKRLTINHMRASDILPPADFSGVAAGFKVYIPEGSDYEFDYYWSERGLTFERIQK